MDNHYITNAIFAQFSCEITIFDIGPKSPPNSIVGLKIDKTRAENVVNACNPINLIEIKRCKKVTLQNIGEELKDKDIYYLAVTFLNRDIFYLVECVEHDKERQTVIDFGSTVKNISDKGLDNYVVHFKETPYPDYVYSPDYIIKKHDGEFFLFECKMNGEIKYVIRGCGREMGYFDHITLARLDKQLKIGKK